MRNYICEFNQCYEMQGIGWDASYLLLHLDKIYTIGISDIAYWEDTNVDFRIIRELMVDLEPAFGANDLVYLYDKLNYEIWKEIRKILEVLFKKNDIELKSFFWSENEKALKMRYPQVLEKFELLDEVGQGGYVRQYGLRGKVVYRKTINGEYDLFSGYAPFAMGRKVRDNFNLDKYNRLYIWEFDGAFEIDEIMHAADDEGLDTKIVIAVTDINEFRHILLNTKRNSMILHPNVEFVFDIRILEFLKKIDLNRRDNVYVLYIGRNEKEIQILEDFMKENCINSNICGQG